MKAERINKKFRNSMWIPEGCPLQMLMKPMLNKFTLQLFCGMLLTLAAGKPLID